MSPIFFRLVDARSPHHFLFAFSLAILFLSLLSLIASVERFSNAMSLLLGTGISVASLTNFLVPEYSDDLTEPCLSEIACTTSALRLDHGHIIQSLSLTGRLSGHPTLS
jgi:hypothetical protein